MQSENDKNFQTAKYRLKKLIDEKCGGSIRAFARKCHLPQPSVHRWMAEKDGEGISKIDSLLNICKTFRVSSDWLLGLVDAPENAQTHDANTTSVPLDGIKKQIRTFRQKAEQAAEQASALLQTVEEIEAGL